MLIDCHVHTSRYSPCSVLEPASACRLAVQRGLAALVITEHQVQWTESELRELQREFPDLILYSGLEVTLAEGFDVVIITEARGLTFPFGAPMAQVLDRLSAFREESFLFLAHAFRWTEKRSELMERVLDHMDGLEMNSVNIVGVRADRESGLYPPRLPELYQTVQHERGLIPVYNSDAHSPQAVGSLASDIDGAAPPKGGAGLADLLKHSEPRQHQTAALLRGLIA